MKKIRRMFAALSLALALMLGSATVISVRADTGPQGNKESKSKNPSPGDANYEAYLLLLFILWLLGWL